MKPAVVLTSLLLGFSSVTFAVAEEFTPIPDRSTFLSQVAGKDLRLTGYGPISVSLTVLPDGEIEGRGLGRPVTGAWRWQDGYFCRDLFWGQRNLGPNCQAVQMQGQTVRFIADQGTGNFADFAVQ